MTDLVRFGFDLGSSGLNPNVGTLGVSNISTLIALAGFTSPTLDGKIQCQMCKVGSYLYVVTQAGTFYKINAATGAVVDSYAIGNPSSCTPHIVSGIAYFGDDAGYFHAVDTATMDAVWVQGPEGSGGIMTHAVVVTGSPGHVWYTTLGCITRCRRLDNGNSVASIDVGPVSDTGGPTGPLAYSGGQVFAPGSIGVWSITDSTQVPARIYLAGNQVSGIAVQTDPDGATFLAVASLDHRNYLYCTDPGGDPLLEEGMRVWIDHQGGKSQSPIGMDLATGYVIIGTNNWSIQPHKRKTGKLQWKRDATGGSAVKAGFMINNGIFGGVWPQDDGRLAFWKLDQSVGGHTPDWKFGTSTGIDGGANAANKGNLCCPIIADDKVWWGADDKKVYAFGLP